MRDRQTCVGCGKKSPETETNYTLISAQFGWRLTRYKSPEGALVVEWRCPTCWRDYKRTRASAAGDAHGAAPSQPPAPGSVSPPAIPPRPPPPFDAFRPRPPTTPAAHLEPGTRRPRTPVVPAPSRPAPAVPPSQPPSGRTGRGRT
ncbi:MAG TPA: hypothetical protein VIF15_05280 [Polyangiaceae bacterium]